MLKPFVSLATHRFMIATVLVIVSMWISYMYIQRQSETIHKLEVDLERVAQEIATRDVVISNLEFRLNVLQETIDVESVDQIAPEKSGKYIPVKSLISSRSTNETGLFTK